MVFVLEKAWVCDHRYSTPLEYMQGLMGKSTGVFVSSDAPMPGFKSRISILTKLSYSRRTLDEGMTY